MSISIIRLRAAIALIAFCTLVLELSLVRVFDVILTPSMGYAVITAAVFALGLGGIYLYIFPLDKERSLRAMPWLFAGFAASAAILLPVINWLPFELNISGGSWRVQALAWFAMYAFLVLPFFMAGLIISLILTHFSSQVHSLYFFDLAGAGIGCVILIPLITPLGPGGIQMLVVGLSLVGTAMFSSRIVVRVLALGIAAFAALYPASQDDYLEYRGHANKRNVDRWQAEGLRDYVEWDPVSKMEVFNVSQRALNFALDGGQQGSWLLRFDGDFERMREKMRKRGDTSYYGISSAVHFLRHGTTPEVLIIGAAVGGETNSALLFGARHVDAIELVGAMVNAAKTRYADYSGQVFNHPKVDYRVGEGRTFLRASDKRYDIIQMFSNHTSSSIADGSGAVAAAYLQTAEAYEEYFTHLQPDGIMQVNHHLYPRMLTTAALAWQRIGRENFSRHVLVIERWMPDTLPTVLIQMQPWTRAQVDTVIDYMNRERSVLPIPEGSIPSPRIHKDHPFTATLRPGRATIDAVSVWVGTYLQEVDYPVHVEIVDASDRTLVSGTAPASGIKDNHPMVVDLPPTAVEPGVPVKVVVSAENPEDKGISVWIQANGDPLIDFRGHLQPFVVAFDPIAQAENLIPAAFLDGPFPAREAERADYEMSPATDDNPYFGMIRERPGPVSKHDSPYLDGGTEQFLNVQLLPFLSSDWLNLVLVASISVVFSTVFIFAPLFFSRHGRARWPGMANYLIYFSCLGAGFIIVELVFVQIFRKLIGFPTHTYATVIFSLLLSAGLGSLMTRRLRVAMDGRWRWVFGGIVALGALFIFSYSGLFHLFLAQPLAVRIAVAVLLLFPVGFLMGMPLPIAVNKLGELQPLGIPWAWGMNGFFTVFGGFLSILLSYLFGFKTALAIGFAVYLLAFWMYSRMERGVSV